MGLSKLAARCQACPFVDKCDHKKMEAYGFLPLPSQQSIVSSEPTMNEQLFLAKPTINVDELVKHIAEEIRLPEQLLRGVE